MAPLSDSQLAATLREVLRLRAIRLSDGVSPAELNAELETTLRQVWPYEREWHYECPACQETGYEHRQCRPGMRCGGVSSRVDHWKERAGKYLRLCTKEATYTHDYVTACTCRRGVALQTGPARIPDGYAAAGKQPKPMSRFGR